MNLFVSNTRSYSSFYAIFRNSIASKRFKQRYNVIFLHFNAVSVGRRSPKAVISCLFQIGVEEKRREGFLKSGALESASRGPKHRKRKSFAARIQATTHVGPLEHTPSSFLHTTPARPCTNAQRHFQHHHQHPAQRPHSPQQHHDASSHSLHIGRDASRLALRRRRARRTAPANPTTPPRLCRWC